MACLQSAYFDVAKNLIARGSSEVSVHCDVALAFPGIASNFIKFRSPRGTIVNYPSVHSPQIAATTTVHDGVTNPDKRLVYTKADPRFTGVVNGHVPAGQLVLFGHLINITLEYSLILVISPGVKNVANVIIEILSMTDPFTNTKPAIGRQISFDVKFFPKIALGTACTFQPSATDKTAITLSNLLPG